MSTRRPQQVSGNAADTRTWAALVFQLSNKLDDIDEIALALKRQTSSRRSNARGTNARGTNARGVSTGTGTGTGTGMRSAISGADELRADRLIRMIQYDAEHIRRNVDALAEATMTASETVGVTGHIGNTPRKVKSGKITGRTPVSNKEQLAFLKQMSAAKNAISKMP